MINIIKIQYYTITYVHIFKALASLQEDHNTDFKIDTSSQFTMINACKNIMYAIG